MERTWLIHSLRESARGKRLQSLLDCKITEDIPGEAGLVLSTGSDYQSLSESDQERYSRWSREAGRVLLLLPPFAINISCSVPIIWKIEKASFDCKQAADPKSLAGLLAAEVRYALHGQLQEVRELCGTWANGAFNTALFRHHPHSGAIVITTLPLWSLSVLQATTELTNWFAGIAQLGGALAQADGETRTLSDIHYAILLQLDSAEYASMEEAVKALSESEIFDVRADKAIAAYTDLESQGLVESGKLSADGEGVLSASAYGVYRQALREKDNG